VPWCYDRNHKNAHTTLLTFSSVNQSYPSLSKADVVIAKAALSRLFIYLFAFELKKKRKENISGGLSTRKYIFLWNL